MVRLVAINTIGLTGAEIIAAELARFPEILMLPGQNFIGFRTRTYRPHDYSGWAPADVFSSLDKHHSTRQGRVWAGLTKSMSPEMLERYDRERHLAEFVALTGADDSTIDHFEHFTTAYATANDIPQDDTGQFGFFGNNIVVNASHYPDFLERSVVVDFTNPIDYWIANVGQRMVWNNLGTTRFWLVNMLHARRWARRHTDHYLAVDSREYAADQGAVRERLAGFLGTTKPPADAPPDGFIAYAPAFIESIERNAAMLRTIYDGWGEFELGLNFGSWADGFLDAPGTDELLDRYEVFWNTTSHTNLDWVGPIGDELVEAAVAMTGVTNRRNLNRWFYHEAFDIHSDSWAQPHGALEHYLGALEDEIVLPAMASHARIVLVYLERVSENIVKRAFSALPVRETSLYRRLKELEGKFPMWELTERFAQLETKIDEADEAMEKFF